MWEAMSPWATGDHTPTIKYSLFANSSVAAAPTLGQYQTTSFKSDQNKKLPGVFEPTSIVLYQHLAVFDPKVLYFAHFSPEIGTGKGLVQSGTGIHLAPAELRPHESQGCCSGYQARSCSGWRNDSSWRCCSSCRRGQPASSL